MPAQEIAQANPPPDPSLLPDSILSLKTELPNKNVLSPEELSAVQQYRRAADYLAAGLFTLPLSLTSRWLIVYSLDSHDLPEVEHSHREPNLP